MKSAEKKRSVIVGLFVLIGIIILLAGIFIIGGQQNRFGGAIKVTAIFDNAAGLKKGGNVWFSGVKVGTIREVNFTPASQVEIVMVINDESKEYIRKDAAAVISSEGFIGNKMIVIEGGSSDIPFVEDGDQLRAKEGNDTEAMMATLQVNNENLVAITNDVKALSERVRRGEGTIGAFFTDSLMAENMKAMLANLNQAALNSRKVSENLAAFSEKLNSEGGLAGDLLTDTTIFASLKSSMAQLEDITQNASLMTDNLSEATGKLKEDDNALGLLLNDEETAAQVKETMKNLEESTEKLNQNMEALQHNFLFRGFFRKQAKREEEEKQDSIKAAADINK
ncbi:MlaD family protein [Albibacterium profundi]|uniref:MlaD family protein n=1 Tax=Albibacterium profundi TaxID=3134906 RepID=A0ABV5CGG9_9SPHI